MSTRAFKIEPGIPQPNNYMRYPFGAMLVGDSFRATPATVKVRKSLASSSANYAKRHPGYRFTVRKVKGGYRVWRVKHY